MNHKRIERLMSIHNIQSTYRPKRKYKYKKSNSEYTEDNIVKVRLQGHCAGCPGAQMTLKGVVERILKESYPEIASVEAVK